MTITHYDLFAGIGAFSLALEEVFTDATIRHIFCEWEQFPDGKSGQRRSGSTGIHAADAGTPRTNEDSRERGTGQARLRKKQELDGDSGAPADTRPQRRSERPSESVRPESQESERQDRQYPDWQRNWQEVAFATCDDTVDDGLPRLVDGVPQSYAKWRQNSLKAYGNGIVPKVAMNIMQAIKETTK